ncbi:VWA domain-containing protein [Microvirga subterranea]|uniref:Ca-activated chloride channel family protein n=1 Tax=Microvirga subterranea TaxID=186651 RepID=A0A370HH16_9HYPH|nr:VWA domain-containing protein [Microvirga subterranea]RDI57190.1 Ca-activated chloride channel family protein [Microvirga subterranea]
MLTFAYPWLALLLPLPWLVYRFAPPHAERRPGVRVPFFRTLVMMTGQVPGSGAVTARRGAARMGVLVLCWMLALASLMRPQWIEPPLHRDVPTRDMLLLVDLSASMDTKDFADAQGRTVDRLTALKQVLDDFVARRRGDRIGVVVFGDAPFTLVPFTTDLKLARQLVQDTAVGMAGPRTAFGDAIGLGISLFDRSTVTAKTMVALTDGNDTASKVPPGEAAGVARDRGIVIHTIAIGDPTAAGEEKLDEAALRDVAERTGGGFYRALDRDQLVGIYGRLDEIETRRIDTVSFRPKTDLYWVPLAAALLVGMAGSAAILIRSRRLRPLLRREIRP